MRLIDADKFLQKVRRMKKTNAECPAIENDSEVNNYETGQQETFDLIIRHLSEQPTAYDVDKVVEQLENCKSKVPVNRILDSIIDDKPEELGKLIAYNRAIEVVKSGGIEE